MEYVRAEMRHMHDCSRASTHARTRVLSHPPSLLRPHSCWPFLSPTLAVSIYLCSSTQPQKRTFGVQWLVVIPGEHYSTMRLLPPWWFQWHLRRRK